MQLKQQRRRHQRDRRQILRPQQAGLEQQAPAAGAAELKGLGVVHQQGGQGEHQHQDRAGEHHARSGNPDALPRLQHHHHHRYDELEDQENSRRQG